MTNFIKELIGIVGKENIIHSPSLTVQNYRKTKQVKTLAIVFVQHSNELVKIVSLCNKENVYIVPQGGNTSKSDAAIPRVNYRNNIVINFKKMSKIIEVDKKNNSITVEAGCSLKKLRQRLKADNFSLPIFLTPEDKAQIGATISINAGGLSVVKYGNLSNSILGLEFITGYGEKTSSINKNLKNNTYYNIDQLMAGSEGTLGLITKVCLRIYPSQKYNYLLLFNLHNIDDVFALLKTLKKDGAIINKAELMNKKAMDLSLQSMKNKNISPANFYLMIAIDTNSSNEDSFAMKLPKHGQVFTKKDDINNIMMLRMYFPEMLGKIKGIKLHHEVSIPLSRWQEFYTKVIDNYNKFDVKPYVFGHVGDGNIHIDAICNSLDSKKKLSSWLMKTTIAMQGAITGEYGIGTIKKEFLKDAVDPTKLKLMKKIKQIFDPRGIMNSGVIFDCEDV